MTRTFHVNGHISPKLPPFFTLIVRRVPLPQTWSTIFVIPGCAIHQSRIDAEEVDPVPYGIVKAPCMRICHSFSDPGGFMNPHTPAHSPGTSPGPHNGVGSRGIGKHVLGKASSTVLMGRCSLPSCRRHAAPLKSPATMSTCS